MSYEKMTLGPEVWERVFASPLCQRTCTLLKQLFKRSFGFSDLTGITDEEFKRIRDSLKELSIPLPFCEIIWRTEEGVRRCNLNEKQCVARILITGKIDICTCHAGLTEVGIPIIYRDKYCGLMNLYGGLLLHPPSQIHFDQIAERVKDFGIDLEDLKKAYFEVTPVSDDLLKVMLNLIEVVVEEIIKVAIEIEEDKKRIAELENALSEKYRFEGIIGKSKVMQDVFKLLMRVAESKNPILIEGESGTGKELIASTIHYNSLRKNGLFTAINCGGLTESLLESELFGHLKGSFTGATHDKKGLFETADKGTFFLDEIAEMSPALQVKLLRVLQEGTFFPVGATEPRKVDVRIISATNKNLKELLAKGAFREDLYYRLNVIKITLPPLRERKEDIPLLIDHFIKTSRSAKKEEVIGVKENALKALMDYHWPGNIRELQNVIERAIALANSTYITPEDLPEEIVKKAKELSPPIDIHKPYEEMKKDILNSFQKEYLSKLMSETKGNISKASRLAGLSRISFYELLKKHHLMPK